MGLGLNGGGSASARFFAEAGANVTVTDLRSEDILQPSIQQLSDLNIRYTLEKHIISDFENADIVIKNPAVKPDSPYLRAAIDGGASIETDISVFLRLNKRPVIAVTGSKGKSTIVSALHHALKRLDTDTDLGGNITVSPLTFFNDQKNNSGAPVILELSSWQLADIAGRNLLKPVVCTITNIMHDHQDRYNSMDDYAADKAVIFEAQDSDGTLILNADSEYTIFFAKKAHSRTYYLYRQPPPQGDSNTEAGAFLDLDGSGFWCEKGVKTHILDSKLAIKGNHNRFNMLNAAALLYKFGIAPEDIRKGLADFKGIAHRLEYIRDAQGLAWYNDSTATIPEAAAAAITSFSIPVHLITGGTDKQLDFGVLADAAAKASAGAEGAAYSAGAGGAEERPNENRSSPRLVSISLLKGSGTDKIIRELEDRGIDYDGPFGSLEAAVKNVIRRAGEKSHRQAEISSASTSAPAYNSSSTPASQAAVLSPGCTSFGMFKNEFDRGDQFRNLIMSI